MKKFVSLEHKRHFLTFALGAFMAIAAAMAPGEGDLRSSADLAVISGVG